MKLHFHKYKVIGSDYILYTSENDLPSIMVNEVKQCTVCSKIKSIEIDDAEFIDEDSRFRYELELRRQGYKQIHNNVLKD